VPKGAYPGPVTLVVPNEPDEVDAGDVEEGALANLMILLENYELAIHRLFAVFDLRYLADFVAESMTEGDTFTLTVIYPIGG
jgi:hypothetical protein